MKRQFSIVSVTGMELLLAYCLTTYLVSAFLILNVETLNILFVLSAPASLPMGYFLMMSLAELLGALTDKSVIWIHAGIFLGVFLFSLAIIKASISRPIIGYLVGLVFSGYLLIVSIWF